jgi:hypothetical protein
MIRVFVGCDPNHCDVESQQVLEYSLRKNTKQKVDITWMMLSKEPSSPWYSDGIKGWQTSEWATTFSGFRWAIPEVCEFKGRAIYMDSDVIIKADIAELWNQKFEPGKAVLAKGGGSWRLDVCMWDCKAAKQIVSPLQLMMSEKMAHQRMSGKVRGGSFVQQFNGNWNCLDGEAYKSLDDPEIKAIHYTNIGTQPQLRHSLPRLKANNQQHWYNGKVERHWRNDLIVLFDKLFEEANQSGYTSAKYLQHPKFGKVTKKDLTHYTNGKRT